MTFSINKPYEIVQESTALWEFLKINYSNTAFYDSVKIDEYAASRKWLDDPKQSQSFLDTVLRCKYISPVVLLEKPDNMREILDGRQRISVIRDFLSGKIHIPQSLEDMVQFKNLIGHKFTKLHTEIQDYMRLKLTLDVDVIKGIKDEQEARRLFFSLHPGLVPEGANRAQIR